jgi:sugar lactone lactonase YvrE
MEITRVGTFVLGWGEGLVWDERRSRLYFEDCAALTLHWLEDGSDELHTFKPPSMPTGIVPTEDGRLVVVLDDGLHVVDVDAGTSALVAAYPDELGGRCNDACADLAGNVITGKLNMGPAEGSVWRWSPAVGWSLVADGIANTNGPAVAVLDGEQTLLIGDTSADYYAYPYADGVVGGRRVFGALSAVDGDGKPDGATLDADGGYWCALVGGSKLARFTTSGLDRTVDLPVELPTDVTFGGADLDRLYVVSITGEGLLPGALLVIDGLGVTGRPEPRARL